LGYISVLLELCTSLKIIGVPVGQAPPDTNCAILDLNWERWQGDGTADPNQLSSLATTQPFDHCNFTVLDSFPEADEKRWLDVLFKMDYNNPGHREMIDMEGLKAWMPGRTELYAALTEATTQQKLMFFGCSAVWVCRAFSAKAAKNRKDTKMNAQTHSTPFSFEIFESFWPLSGVKVGKILQQRDGKLVGEIFANEGNFVFKVANPERREENIIRDTFAFNFLRARNFQHIPALLQTRERENYQNVDVKFVFVMERIEGSKKGEHLQLALKSRDLVSSAVRCCEVPPEVDGKMRDEKVALHI
jgi:hypothetical protein